MIKQTSNNKLSYILTSYGRIKYFYTSTPDINMTSEVVETFEKSTTIHRCREYYLTDHLGNVRVVFCKQLSTNSAILLQQTHYYAHGLEIANLGNTNIEHSNLYNGKELQDEAGLDYLNYGWRQLDPQLGVWHCVDKLANTTPNVSPYAYANNNPVNNVDVDGLYSRGYSAEQLSYMFSYSARQNMTANERFDSRMSGGGSSGIFPAMYQDGIGSNSEWWAQFDLNTAAIGTYFSPNKMQQILLNASSIGEAGESAEQRYAKDYKVASLFNSNKNGASGTVRHKRFGKITVKPIRKSFDGGKLYKNENLAYGDMWNYSFDSDDFANKIAVVENAAFITNKGILVLPNKNNEHDASDIWGCGLPICYNLQNNYYQVKYDNSWLTIYATIHTHPNDRTGTYINGYDISAFGNFGPLVVIGWDGAHVTTNSNANQQQFCTLEQILSNWSIISNLNKLY